MSILAGANGATSPDRYEDRSLRQKLTTVTAPQATWHVTSSFRILPRQKYVFQGQVERRNKSENLHTHARSYLQSRTSFFGVWCVLLPLIFFTGAVLIPFFQIVTHEIRQEDQCAFRRLIPEFSFFTICITDRLVQ